MVSAGPRHVWARRVGDDYLMLTDGVEGPLWFAIMGPGTHLIGIPLGAYVIRRWQQTASSLAPVMR